MTNAKRDELQFGSIALSVERSNPLEWATASAKAGYDAALESHLQSAGEFAKEHELRDKFTKQYEFFRDQIANEKEELSAALAKANEELGRLKNLDADYGNLYADFTNLLNSSSAKSMEAKDAELAKQVHHFLLLQDMYDDKCSRVAELEAALNFYADRKNWQGNAVAIDIGTTATKALKGRP